jgi:hypothetical protein
MIQYCALELPRPHAPVAPLWLLPFAVKEVADVPGPVICGYGPTAQGSGPRFYMLFLPVPAFL